MCSIQTYTTSLPTNLTDICSQQRFYVSVIFKSLENYFHHVFIVSKKIKGVIKVFLNYISLAMLFHAVSPGIYLQIFLLKTSRILIKFISPV